MITLALLRFLVRTRWSTAMAMIGMALGVTSIVSVHLVSSSVSSRLDATVPGSLASYSHYLHRDQLSAEDYFELRRAWRSGVLAGVEQVAPLIDATMSLEDKSIRVIGVDVLADPGVKDPDSSVDSGDGVFSLDGVWVDETLADVESLSVNGVIPAPKGTLLADIGVAQELLGWSSARLSYIGLFVEDRFASAKQSAEQLLPGFGAGFPSAAPTLNLPPRWQLVSGAEQYPAREFGKSILFNISALGMLALLVAWLLIYQVAVSWLRRLWPVFERLHVIGVEWQALRFRFLIAIALLGMIAATLGLVFGWWLASWLLKVAVPGGEDLLSLDSWVVVKAYGSSLLVCLVGGTWAFQRSKHASGSATLPLPIALILLCVAVWCIFSERSGLAGGFLSIAILSLLASQLVAPLLSRLRMRANLIAGPYLLRVGLREALWHPVELSISIAGLSLAIATSIGVALMVDSFRSDFSQMLDHRLKYDVIATGDERLLARLEQFEVLDLSTRRQFYREADIRINGLPLELSIARLDEFETARYSYAKSVSADEVLLSEQASRALEIPADKSLMFDNREHKVVQVYSSFGELQPRLVADQSSALAKNFASDLRLTSVAFTSEQPEALVQKLRQQFPELELRSQTEIRKIALDTFDQTFAITTVLITIAMLVASISVYIAVTTLRLNRRTGSQLLNTLGVTKMEQSLLNIALGAGLGLVAIVIALPLGVLFGWILCDVINPRAFGWTIELNLSVGALLVSSAWGMLAAIGAGLLQSGGREEGVVGAR